MISFVRAVVGVGAFLVFSAASTMADTKLLMFEEDGCPWCELWRAEVGVIYDKTDEGKQAPLVVLNLFDPVPEQYSLKSDPVFSPTFILVEDGTELSRIEGYPGESFFWGLLEVMLDRANLEEHNS